MKITIKKPVEITVKYIRIQAAVRYEDEDMPFDFPGRTNDVWDVTVDIDSGTILDWQGIEFDVYMKVCDEGSYTLLDENKNVIANLYDSYVPNSVIPGEYGDYIDMKIGIDGRIKNWPKNPNFSEFFTD
jgi:hypothetical protein